MLSHLFFFEWKFYSRKISFYVMLLFFLVLGFLIGTSARIAFPNITYNSPYAINFLFGLFSLAIIFPILIMASQSLLREKDNRFEQILYATPITVKKYLISRFALVFGVAVLSFLLFLLGYILGHIIEIDTTEKWGKFNISYYLNSFFLLVLPNIFLCAAIICCVAWFSKSKMHIYMCGLGIYILFMVASIFSNSPLIAGGSPSSENAMNWAAKLDPFGMAAFFEQTHYWSALQRNTTVLQLSGNFLYNRIAVLFLAVALLFVAFRYFEFKISNKQKKKFLRINKVEKIIFIYAKTNTKTIGKAYFLSNFFSFLKIDLKATIKSIPFVILVCITLFMVGMEMYGAIEGGIRMPQLFVTTPLMINTILSTLPIVMLLAMLFYASELVWKSKNVNFLPIENSTPYSVVALFISKCIALFFVAAILIFFCMVLGVVFQVMYHYPIINWKAYISLFYFIGLPVLLCGSCIVAFQYLIKSKYIALVLATIFLVLTNSSIGKMFGFSHPTVRFANFLPDVMSDMNGIGYLPKAFLIKMLYSLSFVILLSILALNKTLAQQKWKLVFVSILPITALLFLGNYMHSKTNLTSKKETLTWQQQYEEKYKIFEHKPQPCITDVQTIIDLYPEKNSYRISGSYILVNKTTSEISEILLNTSTEIRINSITSNSLILFKKDVKFGQYIFKTKQKLFPNDSIKIHFDFEYHIEPLNEHQSFNAIVDNGSFMRISRYYPTVGYNADNEIEDLLERKNRAMPPKNPLKKVDAPLENPYNYQFINWDATVSTSANQTAISVGEMVNHYSKNNRNYYQYRAKNIPFRFAVSSAKYVLKKVNYKGISIEILYDAAHHQSVNHLVASIQKTMNYCENNFGKYPYRTIRFAEISSFTEGFAATAYPATIFVNEKQFHINLRQGEGEDVINEIAGHELSHQWWGNAQLKPDEREGSGVITETLAQYTQLMLFKNEYGKAKMVDRVKFYQSLYNSQKAFSGEEFLYNSNPDNANVIYNKGLVKMYELYVLIGEVKINLALKNLLAKHKFPLQPATTNDLITELKTVSNISDHQKIEKLFKQ